MINKTYEGGPVIPGLNYKTGNGFTLTLRIKDVSYRFRVRLKPFRIFSGKINHGKSNYKVTIPRIH